MKDKLDQIKGVLTDQNTTLKTKLAAIEAAVKAQTLSLEGKLDLLEAAVKALPDYSSQLEAISTAIANLPDYGDKLSAIEAAVKGMPDYGSKFDLIVAFLGEIKDQAEALGTGKTSIASKDSQRDRRHQRPRSRSEQRQHQRRRSPRADHPEARGAQGQHRRRRHDPVHDGICGPRPSERPEVGQVQPRRVEAVGLRRLLRLGRDQAEEKIHLGDLQVDAGRQVRIEVHHEYTFADGVTDAIWYDSSGNFIGDNKTVLDAADDAAATQQLGSPWRMPDRR